MTIARMWRLVAKDKESGWTFTLILSALYVAFLVFMHVHHEMWRDEVHAWTLAKMAHNFSELVTGDRVYEGHPPGWFWYLHIWTWFISSAWGIQLATIVAATGAAILLLRFAPFPRFLKVLLLFSYYGGYEYTVMSRNYVLGWFAVCLFCAAYHPLRVRHLILSFALALMATTSFYGMAMSFFLLGYFVLEQLPLSRSRPEDGPPARVTASATPWTLVALGIGLVGIAFSALTIEPPDPNPFSPKFSFDSLKLSALPEMLHRITAAFLPWRRYSMAGIWDGPYTFWEPSQIGSTIAGACLLVLVLLALLPSWRLMLIYAGAVVLIEIVQQCRHSGSPRHWGHYFMLFLAASWLLRTTFPRRALRLSTAFLALVVLVQVESFGVATAINTKETFSGGRETAAFLRANGLQDLPILAGPDYFVVTVTGFLERDFLRMETEEVSPTVVFHSRRRGFSPPNLMSKAVSVARERKSDVLVISNQSLPDPPAGSQSVLIFTSRPGTVADEVFRVYRVSIPGRT